MDPDLSLQKIYRAARTIRPHCARTPAVFAAELSEAAEGKVYLKLETLQPTGAFKVRGAANKLSNLTPEQRARGVVTASTGNHGRAVAYIAGRLGIPAAVCLGGGVPENKIAAIRKLGAEVIVHGSSQDEAFEKAAELQADFGRTLVHPFDDLEIIAGQGTIGLELIEDLTELDQALVPLSGGGLISGIAFTLKAIHPQIRVVGVSMERAPAMYHSLKAGRPVQLDEEETLADSLRGGIGLDNRHTLRLTQEYVDEVILVGEDEIAAAMAHLFRERGLVVEGAGAVGVAALLAGKAAGAGRTTAAVISGANADRRSFLEAIRPYL